MKILSIAIIILFNSAPVLANYTVPGVPVEDGSYALDVTVHQQDDLVFTQFLLPVDLTGAENFISAQGAMISKDRALLVADNAEMNCDMKSMICEAVYNDLVFDHEQIRKNLIGKGLSLDAVEQRMAVAMKFAGDPIGVFSFKLKK